MGNASNDCKADGGSIFAIDDDVGERRDAKKLDANRRKKPARYSNSFDSLIHGTGPYGLDLNRCTVLDHAGNGARNRGRRGF